MIREIPIRSTMVNAAQNLRTSQLLTIMQDTATDHVTAVGMGKSMTNDRGILWVIARQYICIDRMPHYDETVSLKTWAGKTMHVLFPRYYEFSDSNGNVIIRASAVWTLMDIETRKFVFPDAAGIAVPGTSTGTELPYHAVIEPWETNKHNDFTVPFSYIDLNGHMNNARFFDVAEDILPVKDRVLKELRMEYHNEVRMGEKLGIDWVEKEGGFYLSGKTDKQIFKMYLKY